MRATPHRESAKTAAAQLLDAIAHTRAFSANGDRARRAPVVSGLLGKGVDVTVQVELSDRDREIIDRR